MPFPGPKMNQTHVNYETLTKIESQKKEAIQSVSQSASQPASQQASKQASKKERKKGGKKRKEIARWFYANHESGVHGALKSVIS